MVSLNNCHGKHYKITKIPALFSVWFSVKTKQKPAREAGLCVLLPFHSFSEGGPQGENNYLPSNELSFALVEVPTIPVPAVNPAGVRMLEAYFSWNLITAAFVPPPNRVVSLPGEPAPEEATLVAVSLFSNTCKHFTSAPEEPTWRVRVKVTLAHAVEEGTTAWFS